MVGSPSLRRLERRLKLKNKENNKLIDKNEARLRCLRHGISMPKLGY